MLVASGITTLGKTVLLVVAITFILWSLVTAIFVPRRKVGFPRNLPAYILASAVLFVAQMGAVVWVTGTQEIEDEHVAETERPGAGEEGEGGTTTEPEEGTETGGETGAGGETETEPPAAAGEPAAGKEIFASAGCGACHTLADAGSSGAIGPNLDDAKPPVALVVERVTNGMGAMPAFGEQLSDEQIQDVAAYVSGVAGA